MKFRNTSKEAAKIEPQMAPMIDVVFLLLIFFMLTLKIIEPEGDFNINMPIGAPTPQQTTDIQLPDIKVRLIANDDGSLARVQLGRQNLGGGANVFQSLRHEIKSRVARPGINREDIEIEIDADYHLNYDYVMKAVSACTGERVDDTVIRYVEKIKFAKPRRPTETAS